MSIFDEMNPFSATPGLDPALEALIYGIEKATTRHKISSAVGDYFDEDDDVLEEGHRLDNAIKRRSLGLPNSTAEFNAENDDSIPLITRGLGWVTQQIPEPGFLRPPTGGDSLSMKLSSGLSSKGFEHGASSAIRRRLPGFLRIFGR